MNPINAIKSFFAHTPGLLLAASAFSALLLAGFFSAALVVVNHDGGAGLTTAARTVAHAATAPFRDDRSIALARAEEQMDAETRIRSLQTENRQLRNKIRYQQRTQAEMENQIAGLTAQNAWRAHRIQIKNREIKSWHQEAQRNRSEALKAETAAAELASALESETASRIEKERVIRVLNHAVQEQDSARQALLTKQDRHNETLAGLSRQFIYLYDGFQIARDNAYAQELAHQDEVYALTERIQKLESCMNLRDRQVAEYRPEAAEYFDRMVSNHCGR